MNITINVVTETALEGERIRRFKGEDPDKLLTEVSNYLKWASPAKVKTAPKKAVKKAVAKKAFKSKSKKR